MSKHSEQFLAHNKCSKMFSSVAQLCLTLCDPMDCSTPSLHVHHQLPEFTQTHVHRVSDAIQPSHLLLLPSIFPSIKVFSNESVLCIRWPKWWSFSISPSHAYSGLIFFRIGFSGDGMGLGIFNPSVFSSIPNQAHQGRMDFKS